MRSLGRIAHKIDRFNGAVGRLIAWVALPMVIVQVVVVLMRYVFGIGSIVMQESIVYMHAILFMVMAGYTLLHDGHVRIDIFYREASRRSRAMVDLIGAVVFLVPVCGLVWWVAWPYVAGSWAVLEGSKETSGIPAVFLLKSLILVFAVLVGAQGLSMAVRAFLFLAGAVPPDSAEGAGEP